MKPSKKRLINAFRFQYELTENNFISKGLTSAYSLQISIDPTKFDTSDTLQFKIVGSTAATADGLISNFGFLVATTLVGGDKSKASADVFNGLFLASLLLVKLALAKLVLAKLVLAKFVLAKLVLAKLARLLLELADETGGCRKFPDLAKLSKA